MNRREKAKKFLNRFHIRDKLSRFFNCPGDFHPGKLAMEISVLYIFAGTLWILFSDRLLLKLTMDRQMSAAVSMIKGGGFVLATATVLYLLLRISLLKIQFMNQELKQMTFEDRLTSLPNRAAFYETAKRRMDHCPDNKMALMFIDIDNFKYINDTLGHVSGDLLISEIGKRLMGLSDESRSIYRIGGDEFVVFVHQYETLEEIETYAKVLLHSFAIPFRVSDSVLNVTVSLGIALYPLHGNDVDMLLKCADIAMYKAKSTARGRYTFYSQDIDMQIQERMIMENELWKALEREEFSLCYQPQIDVTTGRINSMEALLRWNNERLGLVSPLKFISIAEETNLINPIGDWVLFNACKFLKKVHDQGHPDISVSVNVSIIQLMQQDFKEKVMKTLSETGVEPGSLELEITESVLIESYDGIKDKLRELKSKGIKIALDDFGTGYSSLSYLTQIPINTLKIDKIFIDTITNNGEDTSLTNMIIMIGRRLGLSIIAEGVETEGQLEYLKKYDCNKIQGYYFSKPLPQDELLLLLEKNTGQLNAQEFRK
jgi:diguanylate cyclase (GGDEF)-like protein